MAGVGGTAYLAAWSSAVAAAESRGVSTREACRLASQAMAPAAPRTTARPTVKQSAADAEAVARWTAAAAAAENTDANMERARTQAAVLASLYADGWHLDDDAFERRQQARFPRR